jgi:hypothetical protein
MAEMIVKRHIAVAILLTLGPMLGSCSGFAGNVADNWPRWAGGMPPDVPPRPGAPGYNEFIAHGQTAPDPTNSIASGPSGASDTTTAGGVPLKFQQIPAQTATKEPAQNKEPVQKKRPASAAKKPVQNTQAATVPAGPPSDSQSSPDPSVGSGGLY